ncbi:hypothetical protein ABH926_008967 [Catenulispora sp. GP43]|uniref:hypothetical protein n=1 Tax=Catenulispora sp. GP43 TaxID=3156263 RepID=UPI003516A750
MEPKYAKMPYIVPITPDFPPAAGLAVATNATIEVTLAPELPELDGGQNAHDSSVRFPSSGLYYQAWQPYSPAQVAAAYPAHSAVIAIELAVDYGTGTAED